MPGPTFNTIQPTSATGWREFQVTRTGYLAGLEPMNETTVSACRKAGAAFMRSIVNVAHVCEDKQGLVIAAEAGLDPGHFSKALHHQGLHFCVQCHLPFLMNRDPPNSILRGMATWRSCLVAPKPTRSPEEENRLFREWCDETGIDPEKILGRVAP
jgi:hypothetical protein